MGYPPQCAHAARDDDHGLGGVGTAGKGRLHALEAVQPGARRQAQAPGQLFGYDPLGVLAQHHMQFVLAESKVVEQTLRVKGAAGPGDSH